MDKNIFDIFTKNHIYFCEKDNDIKSSSLKRMKQCFDIFIYDDGWLFYRLTDDCVENGYVDTSECLIRPCENYDIMVCFVELFHTKDNKVTSYVDYLDSNIWIEEEIFYKYYEKENIKLLINEFQ